MGCHMTGRRQSGEAAADAIRHDHHPRRHAGERTGLRPSSRTVTAAAAIPDVVQSAEPAASVSMLK